jgi:hypothetical protein
MRTAGAVALPRKLVVPPVGWPLGQKITGDRRSRPKQSFPSRQKNGTAELSCYAAKWRTEPMPQPEQADMVGLRRGSRVGVTGGKLARCPRARAWIKEFQVPVIVEFILVRATNTPWVPKLKRLRKSKIWPLLTLQLRSPFD